MKSVCIITFGIIGALLLVYTIVQFAYYLLFAAISEGVASVLIHGGIIAYAIIIMRKDRKALKSRSISTEPVKETYYVKSIGTENKNTLSDEDIFI